MSTFLLVHGAFRGGWSWRRVRPILVAAGHDVYAPSLLGAGERESFAMDVTGLDSWVDELEELVRYEDLDDLVLVGHSQGGLATTALAARVAERVRALVHLDAAVPRPGESALELLGAPRPYPERGLLVPARPVEPGEEYDETEAAWVSRRLTATPIAPSLDPMPELPDGVRQIYAFCDRTPAGFPSTFTRDRLDAEGVGYRILAAGHDAPLTAPDLVAGLLLDVVLDAPASHI